MNHYTYLIEYSNGMKYIGARSCKCIPCDDIKYLGSSKIIPKDIKSTGIKTILGQFECRPDAIKNEMYLHKLYDVKMNKDYYNQVNQTSTKFDQQGCTAKTHKHVKAMAEKLTGRKAEDYEYIQKANEKRTKYRGDNRTDAQKLGAIKVGIYNKGRTNPLKACKGIKNGWFKPWYYITPEGIRAEVYTVTKQDFAPTIGVTFRQLVNRFHYTNIDKKAKTKPLKGWTFGNL